MINVNGLIIIWINIFENIGSSVLCCWSPPPLHDHYCDNLPDYFEYNGPYDWEELQGLTVWWNMECGLILSNQVSGDKTIFSQAWVRGLSDGGVAAPEPNITKDGDRPPSTDSDHPGKTESHRTEFGTRFGTSSPMLRTHQNRMIPELETDRPH